MKRAVLARQSDGSSRRPVRVFVRKSGCDSCWRIRNYRKAASPQKTRRERYQKIAGRLFHAFCAVSVQPHNRVFEQRGRDRHCLLANPYRLICWQPPGPHVPSYEAGSVKRVVCASVTMIPASYPGCRLDGGPIELLRRRRPFSSTGLNAQGDNRAVVVHRHPSGPTRLCRLASVNAGRCFVRVRL